MRTKHLVKAGVTLGVAGLILVRVPAQALQSAFIGVEVGWLVAALACVAAMLAARVCRWHELLTAGGVNPARADSARSLVAGFTLSLATPGRTGELARCLFVAESQRAPVLMLTVLDRALDMWALFTYAVIGVAALSPRPHGIFAAGVWLALLPAVMGLPTFVSHLREIPWWPAGLRGKLRQASHQMQQVRTPSFAALALLSTTLDMLTFYCLVRAFQPLSLGALLTTFPFIVIAGGLPISISGLGPREGVAAMLLARHAVPHAVAIDAALLLWVFSAVLPAIVGGVWLLASRSPLPRFSLSADYADATDEQSA